ncbi:hypothetical protein D3C72_891650 [compost metagenome]
MPSAMAPELTSTTSLPATRSLAICDAQRAMASWSSPLPSLVTRLEPTLTTMRFACAMTDCMTGILSPGQPAAGAAPELSVYVFLL